MNKKENKPEMKVLDGGADSLLSDLVKIEKLGSGMVRVSSDFMGISLGNFIMFNNSDESEISIKEKDKVGNYRTCY